MARSSLQPWLAASKCLRKNPSQVSRIFARTAYTAPHDNSSPLESGEDWRKLQEDRAYFKSIVDFYGEFGSTQTRDNTFQPHHSLHRPLAPSQLTLSALIAAGAHFGHSKSLLNPNFMPYAYGVRAGITIIDLDQTLPLLRRAANLTRAITSNDGTVVFVGTRPELRPTVRKAAERIGGQAFHVGERWLPGTLTNKLQMFGPEVSQEQRVTPDLVVFLNPLANMHAIRECAIQHVPTIGIVDSNVDPRIVMYPIPANDESPRTAELIAGVLSVAGREGKAIYDQNEGRRQLLDSRYRRGRERNAGALLAGLD
ncbi:ribosomal protein S2 [Leucogyrophana mollusca]|uniref:Ribosomal protein S2 n=1 Tax=Leucogyrophana mollusca TaxID=85980 RepID=A0ACB8BGE4_9AGAM|nr:ribosomal protein S2 [Leucogyrophana mollusca]